MDIHFLLEEMIKREASDLHIVVGAPPVFRINGNLMPLAEEKMTKEETRALIYSLMNEEQKKKFEGNCELDFSLGATDVGRFKSPSLQLLPF